jgi:hypothetical protein
MRNLFIVLLAVTMLCLNVIVALAAPSPDDATAAVTVTVDVIGEWAGDFNTIALSTITAQGSAPTGSQATTLYTNGDVDITADVSTAAQLKKTADPNQTLVTSYKLTDDGDGGITATGGTDQTVYTVYDEFLGSPYAIIHAAGDGDVVITLYAEAKNLPGEIADAGAYSATQTLTATW